jgi:hypothetical protein
MIKRNQQNRKPFPVFAIENRDLLALVSLIALSSPAALADPNSLNSHPTFPHTMRPPTADKEFSTIKLTEPIQIPNVPPYSGRVKFIEGLRYPNDSSGERVGLTYAAAEDSEQVLDWYRTALKNYKWNVLNFSPSAKSITAVKDGSTFTLQINPAATQPGYRTVMVLSYKTHK